ncbi:hypothetical protein BU23DRAFT_271768 [Bimuria novae-zelandiae CBS 107.79]|uniref:Uncharacterized protein n=1 Tax=Bimuria novae-zelandiae CBS 107.79 TaxID=1447943 RepID=A0A6A5VMJ8_9PLEO|nr:hypothetical protein BU23DRAFT_271768 [Bimuria novae-zelandiae CBS 107.79]
MPSVSSAPARLRLATTYSLVPWYSHQTWHPSTPAFAHVILCSRRSAPVSTVTCHPGTARNAVSLAYDDSGSIRKRTRLSTQQVLSRTPVVDRSHTRARRRAGYP